MSFKGKNFLTQLFFGRINRGQYISAFILVFLTSLAVAILSLIGISRILQGIVLSKTIFNIQFILGAGIYLVVVYLQIGLLVRRLHDFNASGWLILVPIVNSFLPLIALFVPSEKTKLSYGNEPGQKTMKEIIFNNSKNEDDRGEIFLPFILSILLITLLVLWFFSVNEPYQIGATKGEVHGLCGSNYLDLGKNPDQKMILKQMISGCPKNFNGIIVYPDSRSQSINTSIHITSSSKLLAVMTQELRPSISNTFILEVYNLYDYSLIHTEALTYPADFDLNQEKPFDFVEANNDNFIDLRVYAPYIFGKGYKTFIFQPDQTYKTWKHLEKNYLGYIVTDNEIFFGNQKIPQADLSSFVILDSNHAKDNNHLYEKGRPD